MTPLLPFKNEDVNWHSCQSNTLPEVFIQNASLEISWTKVLTKQNNKCKRKPCKGGYCHQHFKTQYEKFPFEAYAII